MDTLYLFKISIRFFLPYFLLILLILLADFLLTDNFQSMEDVIKDLHFANKFNWRVQL
jgi:hypothetical protein